MITGSDDKTAIIWELSSGNISKKLQGHSDLVSSVVFSSDSNFVATGSSDKIAVIW